MIVCWPITAAVKHAVHHHVVPRVIRPIRRVIAARPPMKTVTKWACIVAGGAGAAGGGAVYGPGLFSPPATLASGPPFSGGPSLNGSPGGLLFPTPGSSGFEFAQPVDNSTAPEFLGLPPYILRIEVPVGGFTPDIPAFVPALFTPTGDTSPQAVAEPSSLLLLAPALVALALLRRRA